MSHCLAVARSNFPGSIAQNEVTSVFVELLGDNFVFVKMLYMKVPVYRDLVIN